jgi:NtrC-family two-component system response regulator AlgB
MLKVVEKQDAREASEELLPLDEIAREGARRMLIEALKAEADDYVERHRGERDEQGRAQAKFLRFVQERSFERVGGEKTIHVDARIVAASNRDLAAEVTARHFREDLFYRLNVISLRVPPLRERAEDLLPLVDVLLSGASVRNRRARLSFSPEAQAVISNYPWPGNVRELRNAVERAVVLSQSDLIGPECLPDSLFQPRSQASAAALPSSLEDLEREQIMRVLVESPTLQDAAVTLGINATTLRRKRKRYHLD